jgi:hypothetical protein
VLFRERPGALEGAPRCSRGSTRCWCDVLEGAPGAGGAGRGAGAAGGRVAGHLTEEEKKLYKKQTF